MKVVRYSDVEATRFDNEVAKGVAGRVVIGKNDGADNFCMRIFEITPGGNTPKHTHDWEHEIFFHSGDGEVFSDNQWKPVKPGSVVFIPSNEEHQIRNSGNGLLTFVCLVPAKAPEL
jgi:quercetin dioxygenase-like cupin family protein